MTTQSNSSASPNAKEEDVSAMLMLLISIERDRCMSLPEGDERASALGDLVDGAPHLMDRIKAAIQEFSKLKKPKVSHYSEMEQRFIYKILSAVNGNQEFLASAEVRQVSEGRNGSIQLSIEGYAGRDAVRYSMAHRSDYEIFNGQMASRNPSMLSSLETFTTQMGEALLRPSVRNTVSARDGLTNTPNRGEDS